MDYADLLRRCYRHAEFYSDDLSNRNAALLIDERNTPLAIECNRIPDRVEKSDERISQRPKKYAFIEHAERGVIYKAARQGIATQGLTMVCPWFACADCARAIVCAGITKVVGHEQRMEMTSLGRDQVVDTVSNRWSVTVSDGDKILQEAGVELFYYDGLLGVVSLVNEQERSL